MLRIVIAIVALATICQGDWLAAQPPGGPGGRAEAAMERLMKMDTDGDGKISKEEMTDDRLKKMFDKADADKDGFLTKEEIMAVGQNMRQGRPGRGGPGGGGPGGGGPGGGGPDGGGPGGPGGFGPPPIGQVLPPPVQDELNLNDDQRKQLEELQKDVDDRLAKLLSAEQKKQLEEMKNRRGFGPPGGGPGGPGGRGGRPGGGPPGGGEGGGAEGGGRPRRPQ